jgi:glycosyltransferase involved in cell wall biosynthesis
MVHSLLASTPPRSFFDSLEGFICISKGIRERLDSPRGIYIPPFIDVGRFRSSLRYDLGHSEDALIGTMGAPFHRKGIRYLVEAIPLVLERYPKAHFFLAIDLPGIQFMEETRREREYIDRFIEAHQLREKVDLLGHVDVPQFLRSLDLFVYAVQTTMGMIDIPPTLLECLAAGCGVVTSQKGGIGELIRDRHNGLFVGSGEHDRPQAYAERILELLNNRDLLKTIRDNGPRSIEEFDLDRVGRKIFQFYQSILEQRRRGRE